eukprot:12010780-Ditylum_brightwellii.AAC.1
MANAGEEGMFLQEVQDPTTTPPPKEKCPTYMVDSLFMWMRYIRKKALLLDPHVAADKQTTVIQEESEYEIRWI